MFVTPHLEPNWDSTRVTHISDDFHQVVGCAAGVAHTLHGRQQVWRRVAQQHTHLVGLTSGKGGE